MSENIGLIFRLRFRFQSERSIRGIGSDSQPALEMGAFFLYCDQRWLGIRLDFLGALVVFLATLMAVAAGRASPGMVSRCSTAVQEGFICTPVPVFGIGTGFPVMLIQHRICEFAFIGVFCSRSQRVVCVFRSLLVLYMRVFVSVR